MRGILALDRRRAVADVAAALTFGGRGGEQHLIVAQPAQQQPMPGAAAAVTRKARDLGLMHRVDHGGGGAGAAEYVADIDHVADAGSFAAELAWNRNPHEALGARRGHRLGRKRELRSTATACSAATAATFSARERRLAAPGATLPASTLPRTTALAREHPAKQSFADG